MTYIEYKDLFLKKMQELDDLRAETWRMYQINTEYAAIIFYNSDKKRMQVTLTRNVAGVGYIPVKSFEDDDVSLFVISTYLTTVTKIREWEEGKLLDFPYATTEVSDELQC